MTNKDWDSQETPTPSATRCGVLHRNCCGRTMRKSLDSSGSTLGFGRRSHPTGRAPFCVKRLNLHMGEFSSGRGRTLRFWAQLFLIFKKNWEGEIDGNVEVLPQGAVMSHSFSGARKRASLFRVVFCKIPAGTPWRGKAIPSHGRSVRSYTDTTSLVVAWDAVDGGSITPSFVAATCAGGLATDKS